MTKELDKIAHESDYLIGVGSILPHVQSGWGGECKILQPGICSDQTTQETHLLAVRQFPKKVNRELLNSVVERTKSAFVRKVPNLANFKIILYLVPNSF